MYILIDVIDEHLFVFGYWCVKMSIGMNQDWQSTFQISYQKIVS